MSVSPIATITRAATRRPGERLNVLAFPTHERWQSGLASCNTDFWLLDAGMKKWNYQYAPLPANHRIIDPAALPAEIDFDVILAQAIGQFQYALPYSRRLQLPIIRMEHTLPYGEWKAYEIEAYRNMRGHMNVTCSQFNVEQWGFPESFNTRVIHHGVDTDLFSPSESVEREPVLLSVVNDWINRDYWCGFKLWQEATAGLPVQPVGDTPGLSRMAKNTEELVSFYRKAQIFVNTTLVSSAPVSPLEAMACECAVVSTNTTTMPNVIQHGVNGFLGKDAAEIRHYCQLLLSDPALCRRLGKAARQTIIDHYSPSRFAKAWDDLLWEAANIPYLEPL